MPVRTSRDKQPERDRQPGRWTISDCLACLSHLYIGDRYRQGVRAKTPWSQLRVPDNNRRLELAQPGTHQGQSKTSDSSTSAEVRKQEALDQPTNTPK